MGNIKLVYEQVKEYILNEIKTKKPGEFLNSEVKYATLLNISRPTVRKAVEEIIGLGLVKRIPGKGLVVCNPDEARIEKPLLFMIPYLDDDGFFYKIMMGCVEAANQYNFSYKILNYTNPSDRLKIIEEMDISEYSGVVLTAYENETDYRTINLLKERAVPYILVDNPLEGYDEACVVTDDYKGGYLLGRYLAERNHREILYITKAKATGTTRLREQGFKDALNSENIDFTESNMIRLAEDQDIIKEFGKSRVPYTAICGYSDLPVIILLNSLCDRGVNIPNNISMTGYGNFRVSELARVPLTTVSMPVYEMGFEATVMLINSLKTKTVMRKLVLEDVRIIERKSVKQREI